MKVPFFTWFFLMQLLTILLPDYEALVSGQCQKDQQSLLLQIKDSLNWTTESGKRMSWNQSTDCCKWAGISCDGVGHITGLDLSKESISGGIENATGLFSLRYLKSLNLSFNNFNTTLPTGLGNLTELLSVNLSNAGFVDQIPIEISKLAKLVSLDLSMLYFPGVNSLKLENPNLATLVQNLPQLRVLRLDGVNISANGTEWCQALSSSLPNLQVLSLSNCFLSGSIHPSLAKLQSLSVIRLRSNELNTSVPEFFANFSKLTLLHLGSCNLHGTFPKSLFQVPTLEVIDLSNNEFLQGSLPIFHGRLSLQTLMLSGTNFSGTLPESIGNLVNLSTIELANCNFSGPIPSSMAALTRLVYLDFSFNSFSGPIPPLRNSKNLNYVDFSNNNLSSEIPSTHMEGLLNLFYVNLKNNSLGGSIPSSLLVIPSVQKILLSYNRFQGQVPEIPNPSLSSLDTLDLSSNNLEGPIPQSIFDLKGLKVLLLSSNKFNGTIHLDWISKLQNLTSLDLSYNKLTVDPNTSNSTSSSFPKLGTLKLASCNLRFFPNLSSQPKLIHLDLSDNKITGPVPRWIWEVGNKPLLNLNLSHNLLTDLEQPYSIPDLSALDLHDNQLQGNIPALPPTAAFVDYSSNKFTSSIPDDIATNLSFTIFFSLSNNSLTGSIPNSLCNGIFLQVLDLSNNNLGGTIPGCLIRMSSALRVMNLGGNNFTGTIPDEFEGSCQLKTLDLSGNLLDGKVPESLSNCSMLEVLDLGSNQIIDTYPCLLKSIPSLRVMVLRNNRFYGPIGCPKTNGTWPRLQIVDLASNNFTGRLPWKCLTTWEAMMGNENGRLDHLKFEPLWLSQLYYQDSITVTSKGLQMELVKILTVFTSIDFSSNNFEGPIPEVFGQFKGLYVLNLSHNALNGSIPSSLGNLSQLESLDLSKNNLNGSIPQQLAQLTFLSFLNLSYNRLVGRIPTSTQLQTFTLASFEGNEGLCGPPLESSCDNTAASAPAMQQQRKNEFDWRFIITGVGFGIGAGLAAAPLLFCKKVQKLSNDGIDRILSALLPMLGLVYYTSDDWRRIEPEDIFEADDDTDTDEEEEHEDGFVGRYCVFCTKLDITRKKAIHDPKCNCHHSPPISSSSSFTSSLSLEKRKDTTFPLFFVFSFHFFFFFLSCM